MNQWWRVWPKWFSEDDCKRTIEMAQKMPAMEGLIGHGGGLVLDKEYRRSQIRWLPKLDPQFFSLFQAIKFLFEDANATAFGFQLSEFRDVQFTEYHANEDGKYDWHKDMSWITNSMNHRKLSMVVHLSKPEDYEGGKLELDIKECRQMPNEDAFAQGSVIIFPSFLSHRVTTVTKGTRYTLVSWHEGPHFR